MVPVTTRVNSSDSEGPLLANAVLAVLIFVFTEIMLFAGLISAFTITRASALEWPPPGQPRLPVEETAVNTAALLLSGLLLFAAGRMFQREAARAVLPFLLSFLLGGFFVVFQGAEWLALVREGLTLTSSTHGSFFYLIIGLHALHVVAALIALGYVGRCLWRGTLTPSTFSAARIFWYFVVSVWPLLYWRVYW